MQLSFPEFCAVLWRGRVIVVALVAIAVATAYAVVRLQTPVYQSTATVQLTGTGNDLSVLGHVDALSAVYAEALQSQVTASQARASLDGRLAEISVRTFTGSPIIKVDAQSVDPGLAQDSATAVVDVVSTQSDRGAYGYSGIRLLQIQPPLLPRDPVSPRPALTYAVGGVVGLMLGVLGALILEAVRRSRAASEAPFAPSAADGGRAALMHADQPRRRSR